jgi:hypothetical protein
MSEWTIQKPPSKSYNVNYLLAISRLPDHFYALVNGLKGRDAMYQNPGVSLRSFVIGKCIRQEIIEVSGDLIDTIAECEKFSYSSETLAKIVETLEKTSHDLSEAMLAFPPNKKIIRTGTALNELTQGMRLAFDAFIMSQDPSKDHINLFSNQSMMLRSVMYELMEMIETIKYDLKL